MAVDRLTVTLLQDPVPDGATGHTTPHRGLTKINGDGKCNPPLQDPVPDGATGYTTPQRSCGL